MAVPEFAAAQLVGEMAVHRHDALLPHALAVFVAEQLPALQQVLVVRVDAAADVAVAIGPFAGFDIDGAADQADLRAPLEGGHQRALGLVVVDRLAGELGQRAEFEQQGSGLGGIADLAAGHAGAQVDVGVRQAGRRLEHRQQARAKVVREREQAFVAGQLVTGQQATQQADDHLEVLHRHVVVERQAGGD